MRTCWLNSLRAVVVAAFFGGCATPDERAKLLQTENEGLRKDVQDRTVKISTLEADKTRIQIDLDYYTKRADVLAKEKTSRLDDVMATRKGIREFTDQISKSLLAYNQRAEIGDYLGNELINRASLDTARNMLLVDTVNSVAANGTVIGGRAWVNASAKIKFCLLRSTLDKSGYTITAMSPLLDATAAPGQQSWMFDLPLASRRGDLIGVYLPGDVAIPYDDADTGCIAAIPGPAKLNSVFHLPMPPERHRRAYSFGVVVNFSDAPAPEAPPSAAGVPAGSAAK